MEVLFWKVFNNVVLFNTIFKFVENEEIEYYDYKQINVYNRIKFKFISTMGFMVQQRLFSLIKSKIKHDEFIDFYDPHSIRIFFSMNKQDIDKNPNFKSGDNEIFKELLILLLENKRKDFENVDLVKISIAYSNLEALEILLNKFQFQTLPLILLFSFDNPNSNISIISTLLNSSTTVINNFVRNNLLSAIFENVSTSIQEKQDILKLVLKSGILNNNMNNNEEQKKKKFKSSNNEILDDIPFKLSTINIDQLLLFDDIQLKLELFELGCFKTTSEEPHLNIIIKHFNDKNIYNSVESFLFLIKVYCHYANNDDGTTVYDKTIKMVSLKEIKKFLVVHFNSKKLYKIYLSIYDEPIKSFKNGDDIIYKLCFSTFNKTLLKYLLDKKYDIFNSPIEIKNSLSSSKFIKLYPYAVIDFIEYYSNKIPSNKNIDSTKPNNPQKVNYGEIIKLLLSSNENGQQSFNELSSIPKLKLELDKLNIASWNSILPVALNWEITKLLMEPIIIQDKQSIDYLINLTNEPSTKPLFDFFKFTNIESLNYGFEKLILNNIEKNVDIISNQDYIYMFECAISKCDIKLLSSLNSIDGLTIPYLNEVFYTLYQLPMVISMIEYLKSTDYKLFEHNSFLIFTESISKYFIQNKIDSSKFKISFNSFPSVKKQFLENIFKSENQEYSHEQVLHLFNSEDHDSNNENTINTTPLNLFQDEESLPDHFETVWNETFDINYSISFTSYKDIIPIFEYWVNKSKINSSNISNDSYQIIFNHLFEILLSIKYITMDQVIEFVNRYKSIFEIKNSFTKTFRYLSIKSTKLVSYLMEREEFMDTCVFFEKTVFSMDTIFNSTFDENLKCLMNHLSTDITILNIDNDEDCFTKSCNSDLLYLLSIKRVDLFFNYLEFIDSKLQIYIQDESNDIGTFPESSDMGFYPSPINSIKSTSIHYDKEINSKKKPTFTENQSQPIVYPTFLFSDDVYKYIVRVLNTDELYQFLKFCCHIEKVHLLLFKYSLDSNRIEITNWLLENYEIYFIDNSWFDLFSKSHQFPSISNLLINHFTSKLNQTSDPINQKIVYMKNMKSYKYQFELQRVLPYYFKRSSNIQKYKDFINPKTRESTILSIINLKSYKRLVDETYFSGLEIDEDEYEDGEEEEEEHVQEDGEEEKEGEEDDEEEEGGEEEGEEISKKLEESQFNSIINILFQNDTIKMIDNISSVRENYIQEDQDEGSSAGIYHDIFNVSFLNGFTSLCDLILKSYPQFKISKFLIDQSIQLKKLQILKHYYQNGKIEKDNILQYTNEQLKNNSNYKYLNWLK